MKTKLLLVCMLLIMAMALTVFVGCDVENGIDEADDVGDGFGLLNEAGEEAADSDVIGDVSLGIA